jgi:hypothetical protein
MSLDNEDNWQIVYNGFHSSNGENPIGKILIPGNFTRHTIRVYTNSLIAKPTWWLGGTLTHLLRSATPDFEATRWTIPLNRITLIQVPMLTSEYRLKFEPARWHREIALVIESYIEQVTLP